MTAGQLISSIAILEVNWETLKRDYIASFIPFVAQSILSMHPKIISGPEIQAKLLTDFGLEIPQNALRVILKRTEKQYKYVTRQGEYYVPNYAALSKLKFESTRQNIRRKHAALLQKMISFAYQKYSQTLNPEQAEEILILYLNHHDVDVLCCSVSGILPPPPTTPYSKYDFIMNAFVAYLNESDPEGFSYLDSVVKGHMLANALLFVDARDISKRFDGTSIFCDTALLLRAMGYEGESRRLPCRELLDLLHELGAKVKCFRQTRNELYSILFACSNSLSSGQPRDVYHPAFRHFIDAGFTATQLQLELAKLDKTIGNLGIEICSRPDPDPDLQIDEASLEHSIQEGVGYGSGSGRARDHDIGTICSIYRLRKGNTYDSVENSVAIFVTCNAALAYSTAKYFRDEKLIPTGTVPLAVTDYALTTILWLKRPMAYPNLPRKHIIADSFAAMEPPDHLWRKYFTRISKLAEKGDISVDDYYILRSLPQARLELMNITLGDEAGLVDGTVQEILERIRQSIRDEESVKTQKEQSRRLEAELTRDQAIKNSQERERIINLNLEQLARKFAHWVVRVAFGLIILLLALGACASFPETPSGPNLQWTDWVMFGLAIMFIAISLLSLLIREVRGHLARFETFLIRLIEAGLKKWLLPSSAE